MRVIIKAALQMREVEIDVEDDITEDELEQAVSEAVLECFDWSYEVKRTEGE